MKKKNRVNVVSAFYGEVWLILPEKHGEIQSFIDRWGSNAVLHVDEIRSQLDESISSRSSDRIKSKEPKIAVVPILDTLVNRASSLEMISGATSYQWIASTVNGLIDEGVVTDIVYDFHSPGGTLSGLDVAVTAMRRARKSDINTWAIVNDLAASAAMVLAVQADKVLVTKTSVLGSMAAMLDHRDITEAEKERGINHTLMTSTGSDNKTAGHPLRPMDEKQRIILQSRLDKALDYIVSSVSIGRGIKPESVKPLTTGDVFSGEEAIELGLADGFASIHSLVSQINGGTSEMFFDKDGNPITMEQVLAEINKVSAEQGSVQENAVANKQVSGASVSVDQKIDALTGLVTSLAGTVTTLVKEQSDQIKATKESQARALLQPLVSCGALSPSQAFGEDGKSGLFADAVSNLELVQRTVSLLAPNASVPLGSRHLPAESQEQFRNSQSMFNEEEKAVFRQLDLLGSDGRIDPIRVTLPLDENGQQDWSSRESIASRSLNEETLKILGQTGLTSWLSPAAKSASA